MPNQQNNFYSGQQRGAHKNPGIKEAPVLPEIHELLKNGKLNPDNFQQEVLSKAARALENVSKTQMRKVFDEIKRFKFLLKSGSDWQDIYPLVLMQKAKISYLCKRKSDDSQNAASYYNNLKKMIFNLIDLCHSKEEYLAYADFMEALYGYYYEIAEVK